MRRMLIIALLLALGAFALAEEPGNGLEGGVAVGEGESVQIDLDGDGSLESVGWLQVTTADGDALDMATEICYKAAMWLCDLNGDGLVEIFVTGDAGSDDYYTCCLHYMNHRLWPVLFTDINRGANGWGYFKCGYGLLAAADAAAGTVTLRGDQDVLGTQSMCRTLKLSDEGLFEAADDGWWVCDGLNEDAWETRALTLLAPLPCAIDGEKATLEAGQQILITGTDKVSSASFVTRDGRSGTFRISNRYEERWEDLLVAGVNETDMFGGLNYYG